jgi:hypothetical protein
MTLLLCAIWRKSLQPGGIEFLNLQPRPFLLQSPPGNDEYHAKVALFRFARAGIR